METADKILECRDCGAEFVFSVGEQGFYAERGFNEPTHCPRCRAERRQARMSGARPHERAVGERTERQLYPAVCAECGQPTMVPFEPRSGRPVYCRDCFQRMRAH